MAGPGKVPQQQRSRDRDTPERTKLVVDQVTRGPDLPAGVLPEGAAWHPMTVRWWAAWRCSPQSQRMLSEPDWMFLLDTALLHHAMWSGGRWDLSAEVRLRVAKFGATPEDRLRLKLEIDLTEVQTGDDAPTEVSDLSARRRRLLG